MAFESLRGRSKRYLARMAGFYLSVLAFVFFWLLAFNFELIALFRAWFVPALAGNIHFVHNMALASWVWVWGLAMVVQLYRPARRVTAMQVALLLTVIDLGVAPLGMLLAAVTGSVAEPFDPSVFLFFGPVFVAGALHPARGELLTLRGFDRDSVNTALLGLAALVAVPAVLYAFGQLNVQLTVDDPHSAVGHYSTMTFVALSIPALAALAALGKRNRRGPAYAAAVLALVLAASSLFRPAVASAIDPLWAGLAVLWALVIVVAYEWSASRRATIRAGRSGEEPTAAD